jgi:PAS domain S-box-containing protein
VSPSAEPLLGYAPDELAGQTLAAFSDLDVAPIAQALAEQPGVPIFIEGGLRHRDGTMRSFEGNVTNLLADPVVQGFVVNARDVTDRREAETARRRSEMALRAIVQASPVAILALDRRGHVHVWNVACEQMFGWTAPDIVGGRAPFPAEELDVQGLVEGRSRATPSPATKRASRAATDRWSSATSRSRRCGTATGGPSPRSSSLRT